MTAIAAVAGILLLAGGLIYGGVLLIQLAEKRKSNELAMDPKLQAREDAKLAKFKAEKQAELDAAAQKRVETIAALEEIFGDKRAAEQIMLELDGIRAEWERLASDADSNNDPKDLYVFWTDELEKRVQNNNILRHWLGGKPISYLAESLWGERGSSSDRGKVAEFLRGGEYAATGSGFFISEDGWIVTNFHVVEDATEVDVRSHDGQIRQARVAKVDEEADLALLKMEESVKAWIPLAPADASMGASVFTIGFPNAYVQGVQPKFTDGRVSSLSGIRDDDGQYQISVPVQPGNSGGPLVDLKSGQAVGVVVAKLSADMNAENVNYAVKGSCVMKLLDLAPDAKQAVNQSTSTAATAESEVIARAQNAAVMVLVK